MAPQSWIRPCLVAIATALLLGDPQLVQAAPGATNPALHGIKDEHVSFSGPRPGAVVRAIPNQEPALTTTARQRLAAAAAATAPSIGFLTRPYLTWHDITSVFDHCNPDYTTDGKVCRFDGSVGYSSYGVDPSFSRGYAQTPRGSDYLYYDGHNGWDYALSYENVRAAADGTVRLAGIDSINPCFGQNIIVDHPNGYSTRYAHLSSLYVSQGQNVTRGQVIGQSGNTGCSSGPHLHFGVYITSSWTAVDPWGYSGAGSDPWPSDPGNLWLTGSAQFPVPWAPTNVTALAGAGTAVVSWTPSFDGGTGLRAYVVNSSPAGLTTTVPGTATSATITGLAKNIPYTFTVTALSTVTSGPASAASNSVMWNPTTIVGYWLAASDGGIFSLGAAQPFGSAAGHHLNAPVVGMAAAPDRGGYWLVASDGGIFTFGDARYFGSTGALRLNKPVVGMAATPDGQGYWLVASDGGIFTFGDATYYGSTGNLTLNKPVVAMAATPDGRGYWLVASDGGIFTFGDATYRGSTGNLTLNKPVLGMAATHDGGGYWMVASDGGIFTFGDAHAYGSLGALRLNAPIAGMAPTLDDGGYWLVAGDGGIFTFGDAHSFGSLGGQPPSAPIIGMATTF